MGAAVGSIVQHSRLLRALESCPTDSPLARRLRARLVAEAGYGNGAGEAILALIREAENVGDHTGLVELLHLAHHCLLAPEHSARVAVGKAIRRAIDSIEGADPIIGERLRQRVHTDRYCGYLLQR